MDSLDLFGISFAVGTICAAVVAAEYIWPWLRKQDRNTALKPLLLLHGFRFIGLAFLVPGVVSPALPAAFARPAAYGDLVAALLALLAFGMLSWTRFSALAVVWAFNLWGTADLVFAIFQGLVGVGVEPGQLGAAFFIPTVIVPLLLVTHVLVFILLMRPSRSDSAGASPKSAEL